VRINFLFYRPDIAFANLGGSTLQNPLQDAVLERREAGTTSRAGARQMNEFVECHAAAFSEDYPVR
jgi:hypothetical protein